MLRTPKRTKYAPDATEKACTKCRAVKPLAQFSRHPNGPLGRAPRCKACVKHHGATRARARLEAIVGRERPGACECCGALKTLRTLLYWDVKPETLRFRGWICQRCKLTIAAVQGRVPHLEQLIGYLERRPQLNAS